MSQWESLPQPEAGQRQRGRIAGPAGQLEILQESPRGEARGAALICHPHPLHGGTMDNKVVYTLARAALDQGLISLRFQFRGVGESSGPHDQGHGEVDDTAYLLELLGQHQPRQPLFLLGFSFGAFMALAAAARRPGPAGLVTIAPPLNYVAHQDLPQPDCPWLLVHGDADEVVDCQATLDSARACVRPPEMTVMDGVGHFFHGHLGPLRTAVNGWLAEQARPAASQ